MSISVGDIITSNQSGEYEVIARIGKKFLIKFIDTGFTKEVFRAAIRTGKVKDPTLRTTLGGGLVGLGEFSTRTRDGLSTKSYNVWSNMMTRCYNANFHSYSSYMGRGVSVCDEWLVYQNFAAWFYENYKEGYHLDKDIMGGSQYSPSNCKFIPKSLNLALIKSRCTKNGLPAGVRFHKGKGKYECCLRKSEIYGKGYKEYLGSFTDVNVAASIYKKEKELYLKELADHYYTNGMIDLEVRDALYNYTI